MLLTISTTHRPPSDLGYLLHKHPDRVQSFSLAVGKACVFYPESSDDRCTACLMLDVDPIALVRGKRGERTLDQYVNDRPYVASSMLAVAISQVFGTALSGGCKERPDLATTPIPLRASVAALPSGSEALLRRLFEPLGYEINLIPHVPQPQSAKADKPILFGIELSATIVLRELLSHLYVLIPVLDNDKHYYVGDDEVAKLMRHGQGWLARHPERELIAIRYLKYRRSLADEAIRKLREQDGDGPRLIDSDNPTDPFEEETEERLSLHQRRHRDVVAVLRKHGVKSVVDLGCGEGKLVRDLLKRREFTKIIGMDVSHRSLEFAAERLRIERLPARDRERVELLHGSLMYRDRRLDGFDAAVLCEVIEHLDESRLESMEKVVFRGMRPGLVIVTTPNSEYNVMWESLTAGSMRHRDHRFEWTRDQFQAWASAVATRFGYRCEFHDVGDPGTTPDGRDVGAPSQMGVFVRDA